MGSSIIRPAVAAPLATVTEQQHSTAVAEPERDSTALPLKRAATAERWDNLQQQQQQHHQQQQHSKQPRRAQSQPQLLPQHKQPQHHQQQQQQPVGALQPAVWLSCPLLARTQVTHDSYIFTFGLRPGERLGLPVGQHLKLRTRVGGHLAVRSYTPISGAKHSGSFALLIKVYPVESGAVVSSAASIAGAASSYGGSVYSRRYALNQSRAPCSGSFCGSSFLPPPTQVRSLVASFHSA
jgi:Oxidoreductase FAD-binding domain